MDLLWQRQGLVVMREVLGWFVNIFFAHTNLLGLGFCKGSFKQKRYCKETYQKPQTLRFPITMVRHHRLETNSVLGETGKGKKR
jgi:hypothetical protein